MLSVMCILDWKLIPSNHAPAKWTAEEQSQRAYEVLVSEIMLQQTQVETVKPYYERWTNKYACIFLAREGLDVYRVDVWVAIDGLR